MYVISCYFGPHYNGTQLYLQLDIHVPSWEISNNLCDILDYLFMMTYVSSAAWLNKALWPPPTQVVINTVITQPGQNVTPMCPHYHISTGPFSIYSWSRPPLTGDVIIYYICNNFSNEPRCCWTIEDRHRLIHVSMWNMLLLGRDKWYKLW